VKLQTLRARDLAGAGRLDSEYFWSPSRGAAERVAKLRAAGVRFEAVGDGVFGAHVWAPKRFKRIYAAQNEDRAGYLRPHDVFMYLPEPASWLSVERTRSLDHYSLSHGTILQTCSGRNLGPAVMVDSWLEQFVLSHDMVRIEVPNPRLRFFLLAYLRSPIGQELLRRDRTGSVIDHLTADHVAAQLVPIPGESAIDAAAKGMQRAFKKRDRARQALGELLAEFQSQLPKLKRRKKPAEGWTHRAANLVGRLDAAFYDPLVGRARRQIKRLGGVRVRDVAEVRMLGRYSASTPMPPMAGRSYPAPSFCRASPFIFSTSLQPALAMLRTSSSGRAGSPTRQTEGRMDPWAPRSSSRQNAMGGSPAT